MPTYSTKSAVRMTRHLMVWTLPDKVQLSAASKNDVNRKNNLAQQRDVVPKPED
jgi:hypothetical protein